MSFDLMMRPSLDSYDRDVLGLSEAILEDPRIAGRWAELTSELVLDAESTDFQVTVPDAGLGGVVTTLQLLRIAVDAAVVAAICLDDGRAPSIDLVRDVLSEDAATLSFFDAGVSSFWSRLRLTLGNPRLREIAGSLVALIGVGLSVATALLPATGGATLPLVLVGAGAETLLAAWFLFFKPVQEVGGETRAGGFESIDGSKVSEGTSIATAIGTTTTRRTIAHGDLRHIIDFVARVRAVPEVRSAYVGESADGEGVTILIVGRTTLDWGSVGAIAAEFYVELEDPDVVDP